MIYTITLNPCLDVTRNKTKNEEFVVPGGKGINVSIVLKRFKLDNIALGFIGGNVGEMIKSELDIEGIKYDFVSIEKENRKNIKIIDNGINEERNGVSPKISNKEIENLFAKLAVIKDGDILIMSGSVPQGVSKTIYADIMMQVANKKVDVIVDARKELLLSCLEHKPYLIKPNLDELMELFEDEDSSEVGIVKKMHYLQSKGARNVLVSLGDKGAILLDDNAELHKRKAFNGTVISTVGAGDSMVAGFIVSKLINKLSSEESLRHAVACGCATCFAPWLMNLIDVAVLLSD